MWTVDPWFNFRATKYLVEHGFYKFWDWFDDRMRSMSLEGDENTKLIKWLYRNMASSRTSYRWYSLPRIDGDQRRHLPLPPRYRDARRHSKHLRAPRARFLRPHRACYVPPDLGDGRVSVCRSPRCRLYGYHTRLHLAFGSRKLRQRGYCYFPARLHVLPLDQGG